MQEAAKSQLEGEKNQQTDANTEITQILELSDKDFIAAIELQQLRTCLKKMKTIESCHFYNDQLETNGNFRIEKCNKQKKKRRTQWISPTGE